MKNTALLFLIWFLSIGHLQANDYYVLHVKGKITLKSTGQLLKPNDKVSADDEVMFGSADAMAAVVSTEGGRLILQAGISTEANENSELERFVKNNLLPATGRMSTRDAGAFTTDEDFIRHFTGQLDNNQYFHEQYVIIGSKEQHTANQSAYLLDENHTFYVSYTYQGEAINKLLPAQGDAFMLDETVIYQVDDKPIAHQDASNFELYYYNMETEESRLLCQFRPVFISEEALKETVAPLMPFLKNMPETQRIGEVKAYLADIYGKIGAQNIADFLTKHFDFQE